MSPLLCLCLFLGFGWGAFLFILRDLLFHLHEQLLQLFLARLPSVGVHVSRVLLAVWPDGRVAAFEQVVAQLADAAGAGPAHAAAVGCLKSVMRGGSGGAESAAAPSFSSAPP